MPQAFTSTARTKLIAMIVTAIVIAGGVVYIDKLKAESSNTATSLTQTSTSAPATTNESTSPATSSTSGTVADGSYTATSDYYVPHGQESIQVDVTLNNDIITTVSILNSEGDHESAQFQQDFETAYKSYVVGKNIADLKLSVISGASDTTQGFNDALSKIILQAQG